MVPSRYLSDILAVHGVPSAIVANGAEISGLRYRRRGVIRPHLVCTRNFDAIYGVDLVIHAFARIKRDVPSAHLILAGRGPQDAALRALVKDLGVRDVEFCGGVPPHHIGAVLDRADVMVNASHVDNMPVSIRLRGSLDPAALAAAFDEVVRRHETLRSGFGES